MEQSTHAGVLGIFDIGGRVWTSWCQ
jgi:hypothetical protein